MSDWEANKAKVMARLKRAEGQVRAIISMVEREEDCEKVAQQLSAARKALDRAFYDMVACMTQRELAALGVKGADAHKRLGYMTDLLARYG